MTDQRIRELFRDLAEPVPAPRAHTTADLWRRAMRRRRLRRVTAAALTLAVAVTVVGLTGFGQDPEPGPGPDAARSR
ncbi:MAG TPA: hypothetical protein VHJ17_04365, partial [Thermomonospora sp.]|nr:hypothetical protein [Thermomonospora sp.]